MPGSHSRPAMRVPVLDVEVELKWISLVLMVFQNTLLVLIMRYSRVYANDGVLYLTSTAVVMSELFKFIIAITGTFHESSSISKGFIAHLKDEIFHVDTIKLAVPGLLYTVQNNLLFIALSNLEAAIYQVTYQLKILTTAVFSVALLGKHISSLQTISLFILTAGVAAVQLSQESFTKKETDDESNEQNPFLGLICVLLACCSSGFAGVYFEKILKQGRKVSLFVRNIQLSLFGMSLGLVGVVARDFEKVNSNGFFQGYNKVVWTVILVQAGSGFVIASVMKYADNILKGFATAISIILSSVISVYLFDFRITLLFFFGVVLVSMAVFLYGYKKKAKVEDPPSRGYTKVNTKPPVYRPQVPLLPGKGKHTV
uniref:UDP-N-acetylglucosamine transporter n=1 Tax=Aplanochytrium stocchinoi TaxID=215587 RepID=A0A7S3LKD9_9STRA